MRLHSALEYTCMNDKCKVVSLLKVKDPPDHTGGWTGCVCLGNYTKCSCYRDTRGGRRAHLWSHSPLDPESRFCARCRCFCLRFAVGVATVARSDLVRETGLVAECETNDVSYA